MNWNKRFWSVDNRCQPRWLFLVNWLWVFVGSVYIHTYINFLLLAIQSIKCCWSASAWGRFENERIHLTFFHSFYLTINSEYLNLQWFYLHLKGVVIVSNCFGYVICHLNFITTEHILYLTAHCLLLKLDFLTLNWKFH